MKTHFIQQIKPRLRHNLSKHVYFKYTRNCMEPLNDENEL